ncbi:DUF4403 family protein [Gramella jeungdoensis]|uniref:DUF4403 family protein n=1 Tax=Gramella jeungdoensis TaxID=708091 RepID=A0ABT0Z176_9FLAO|nr:DUF4403 family protein [Gramella jeungdoensis]MCM8569319.1 DUF4403 family protein [Gramella jeungdoensis]
MNDSDKISEANFNVSIPVKIGYPVLDNYLREKLVGEIISKENEDGEKSNYAQILDISISKSELEDFDLCLHVNLQTLTSLFKNKQVELLFHASLELNREFQKISLKDYEVDSKTGNWIANQLLEAVINKWMYAKLKEKMNFNFMPHIEEQMDALNEKLENKLEAKEGIHLIGSLDDLEISRFKAGENDLWISLNISANGVVEIEKIKL